MRGLGWKDVDGYRRLFRWAPRYVSLGIGKTMSGGRRSSSGVLRMPRATTHLPRSPSLAPVYSYLPLLHPPLSVVQRYLQRTTSTFSARGAELQTRQASANGMIFGIYGHRLHPPPKRPPSRSPQKTCSLFLSCFEFLLTWTLTLK